MINAINKKKAEWNSYAKFFIEIMLVSLTLQCLSEDNMKMSLTLQTNLSV